VKPRGPSDAAAEPPAAAKRLRELAAARGARTLLRLAGGLDPVRAVAWGGALGRTWARLGLARSEDALVNLRIAFPGWSERRRREVLERSFANLGRGVAELAFLERLTPENVGELVSVEGLEHFHAARAAAPDVGVIALTAHFGNFELLAVAMALRGFPITIVYRERGPDLEATLRSWRELHGTTTIPRGSAARGVLRALREGRVVAMTLDQDTPRREGVFVPFFSRLACTRDAPARIAMRTGAPVLPVFVFRRSDGHRHHMRCLPPLALEPAGSDPEGAVLENVRRMTRVIEDAIREAPDQWAWTHRRWRTQPPGEPRPYAIAGRRARPLWLPHGPRGSARAGPEASAAPEP
jgi:KDO2-lipid IV(A) lauroyltransferase